MLQRPIDNTGTDQPPADVIFGTWPGQVRIPATEGHPVAEAAPRHHEASKIWPDARECSGCGSIMTSTRYRRQGPRFLSAYRCSGCGHRFEQETRGFQGFYLGCLLAFSVPAGALVFQDALAPVQLFVLGGIFGLLMVPLYKNFKLFKEQPVVVRLGGSRLLSSKSGRGLFGRILGGDSRVYGFLLAILSAALFLAVVFSAAIAASAMAA